MTSCHVPGTSRLRAIGMSIFRLSGRLPKFVTGSNSPLDPVRIARANSFDRYSSRRLMTWRGAISDLRPCRWCLNSRYRLKIPTIGASERFDLLHVLRILAEVGRGRRKRRELLRVALQ